MADTISIRYGVVRTDGHYLHDVNEPVLSGQHSGSPSLLHLILDMIQSTDQGRDRTCESRNRDCCVVAQKQDTTGLGDAHLAQLLLDGACPRERSPMSGPYAEERGLCNGVALGIERHFSQTSSRVTTPAVSSR